MKYIGIVGSRRRDTPEDFHAIKEAFASRYEAGDRIVSGECYKGGDRMAELLSSQYQCPILIHRAAWNRLGPKAGFSRNGDIAEDADILIACVAKDRTGGTEDTIKKFKKLGKTDLILV